MKQGQESEVDGVKLPYSELTLSFLYAFCNL